MGLEQKTALVNQIGAGEEFPVALTFSQNIAEYFDGGELQVRRGGAEVFQEKVESLIGFNED